MPRCVGVLGTFSPRIGIYDVEKVNTLSPNRVSFPVGLRPGQHPAKMEQRIAETLVRIF